MPAYNVPDATLRRALASIASQNMIQDIELTIVDDASTKENYENIINPFKVFFPIHILKNAINGGPGVARQIGIDNTNNEYIIFMDADDTFYDCFSIQHLRDGIEALCENPKNQYQMAAGIFLECSDEYKNYLANDYMNVIIHEKNFVHVFSKIYRRSFIEKYEIKFHPTSRANEDAGFNAIVRLVAEDNEEFNFIKEITYCWRENLNSITRRNNEFYSYGSSLEDCFGGYIENMIYVYNFITKKAPHHIEQLKQWNVRILILCYKDYIEAYQGCYHQEAEQNLYWVKQYYDEVYSKLEPLIDAKYLNVYYYDTMQIAYEKNELQEIIPHITFYDFLNKIKKLPKSVIE